MLFLEKPIYPYFLPLVERTAVGLPDRFGKLLQPDFGLLQADWEFAPCTAQVALSVAIIICWIIDVGNLW